MQVIAGFEGNVTTAVLLLYGGMGIVGSVLFSWMGMKFPRGFLVAAIAVLVTGVLRVVLGDKGVPTYMGNWLLHLKFTGFIVIALLSIGPTLAYRRWLKALNANGSLPSAAEVGKTRKLVMIEAHLGALLPLAATFMARGWGS